MKNIGITSLSGHRIDELLAKYMYDALKNCDNFIVNMCNENNAHTFDLLLIINGLNNSDKSRKLVEISKQVQSIYFYDDWTLPRFAHMKLLSQFKRLGNFIPDYFQLSELALFDKQFENINI